MRSVLLTAALLALLCGVSQAADALGISNDAIGEAQYMPYDDLLQQSPGRRPNFVIVMSDDQDYTLGSLDYMPLLQEYVTDKGAAYENFVTCTSSCCPSRVSFLTGLYTHNHNVSANGGTFGGFDRFMENGLDVDTLPVWLQEQGYSTTLLGKFLNGYELGSACPAGWTNFEAMLGVSAYAFYNFSMSVNCGTPTTYREYQTDVLSAKAQNYIRKAAQEPDTPFFLMVTPAAPHAATICPSAVGDGEPTTFTPDSRRRALLEEPNIDSLDISEIAAEIREAEKTGNTRKLLAGEARANSYWAKCGSPPIPAERHMGMFDDVPLPQWRNLGVPYPATDVPWPSNPAKPKYSPGLATQSGSLANVYRRRLESLQAVDEMVRDIINTLADTGLLENTYFLYMGDNGFHIGNHDMQPNKFFPFEEDVRLPFIIRGPGIPEGITIQDYQVAMMDLGPTFHKLAGGMPRPYIDGLPVPLPILDGDGVLERISRDAVMIESWGNAGNAPKELVNKAYRAVRVCTKPLVPAVQYSLPANQFGGGTTCFKYVAWCDNKRQLFDLGLDPMELVNRYPVVKPGTPTPLVDRLEALLTVLATCSGDSCRNPYEVIHGVGTNVQSLWDAMRPMYNQLYAQLPKFKFNKCSDHYETSFETSWISPDTSGIRFA